MKYKIYLRDWYFNAGIIGFLTIAADDKELNSIPSLTIGENYIEFDNNIFNSFEEKFTKHVFLKFFSVQPYLQRLEKVIKNLNKRKTDVKPEQITEKIEKIEKQPYKDFLKSLNVPISKYQSVKDLIANLENAKNLIKSLSKEQIFKILNSTPDGKKLLNNFIAWSLKNICSHNNIPKYINKIKSAKQTKKLKNNNLCPSCQEQKTDPETELNTAVSNIIGLNKDNSNWIWGFKTSKLKICPLCAIIYNCAFASFACVSKNTGKNKYLNYFYFPNQNTKVKTLFETVTTFNLILNNIKDNNDLFQAMIKQTVEHIATKQTKSIAENINFIEIVDNPTLAKKNTKKNTQKNTKKYNIYNYNISPNIAEFLNLQFKANSIPTGYYIIRKTHYNIKEELLKLAIRQQINYLVLYKYFAYYLASNRRSAKYSPNKTINLIIKYNLNKVTNFIIKYIQWIRGENMEKSQKIVRKGFKNGSDLYKKLDENNKENQINGLVYSLLNDLRIADRYKFLDKYNRIMMSYDLPLAFDQDEMLDDDYFLQFGYSFINGLTSKLTSKKQETEENTTNTIKEEKQSWQQTNIFTWQ